MFTTFPNQLLQQNELVFHRSDARALITVYYMHQWVQPGDTLFHKMFHTMNMYVHSSYFTWNVYTGECRVEPTRYYTHISIFSWLKMYVAQKVSAYRGSALTCRLPGCTLDIKIRQHSVNRMYIVEFVASFAPTPKMVNIDVPHTKTNSVVVPEHLVSLFQTILCMHPKIKTVPCKGSQIQITYATCSDVCALYATASSMLYIESQFLEREWSPALVSADVSRHTYNEQEKKKQSYPEIET